MWGTFVNVFSIIIGTSIGALIGTRINKYYSDSCVQSIGIIALALGISLIAKNIPQSSQPLLFIFSIVLGNLIGELCQIDKKVSHLQGKSKNQNSSNLIQGLTTAVLLFCIGTFSILGPINAALNKDYTLLYTNALLDGVTCVIFGASYGIGIALSAIILLIWQGSIYLLAGFLQPFMTPEAFTELNIIGGVLITITGMNILGITKLRTLNFLPALFISLLYMILFQIKGV